MAVTSSSSAPTVKDATRWPAYATKAAILQALEDAQSECGGSIMLLDLMERLSGTDVSALTDKGSYVT